MSLVTTAVTSFGILTLAVAFLVVRLYLVLPSNRATSRLAPRGGSSTVSLGVFLGSGGHTAEMRTYLSAVDRKRYTPRVYVYGAGDEMSLRCVADVEGGKDAGHNVGEYTLLSLPRARAVGESKLSTLVSASRTAVHALLHCFIKPLLSRPAQPWVDVLLINGPGTAVVLVAVTYIRRILGLPYTRIIYIESFARVRSLSLSGRLLRPFVDTFVVQWPSAADGVLAKAEATATKIPSSDIPGGTTTSTAAEPSSTVPSLRVDTTGGIGLEPSTTCSPLPSVLSQPATYRGWLV